MKRQLLELIWAARRRLARSRPRPELESETEGEYDGPPPEWMTTVRPGDDDFGYGYLERWRASERIVMTPRGEAGTSIRLFSHDAPDTPPATHPHVMVEARNLIIDFGRVGTCDELRYRPGYQRVRGGYSGYRPGALLATGTPTPDLGPDLFPRDHLRDIFDSLETVGETPEVDRIIEEPCFFITREPREYENLFHAHTDWLSAFCAVRVLGLESQRKRVVLLDPHSAGPLDEGAARLLSPCERAFRRIEFGSKRILFRHSVFVPPGYSSVLWARQHAISSGPPVGLLQDYGRFFRSAFGPNVAIKPSAPVRVTLLSRRPYPGRGPVLLRQFRSEQALASALRSVPGVVVEVVDSASLSLGDQVRMAANTEILVGAHGAGLAHAFALTDHGAVVEIVADPSVSTYRLYANIAAWTDRLYARIEAPERLGWGGSWLDPDADELRRCVVELAERVRERRRPV